MSDPSPTFDSLIALASGELDPGESEIVERRVAASPELADTLSGLRRVMRIIATADSEDAPAGAVRRARSLMAGPSRRQALTDWIDRAARIIAELVFDGRAQPTLAGYRRVGGSSQMAYEAGGARLDLELAPPETSGDTWSVRGQIGPVGDRRYGAVCLLTSDERTLAGAAVVDEHGMFVLTVEPGRFDLVVEIDEGAAALIAPDLEIG